MPATKSAQAASGTVLVSSCPRRFSGEIQPGKDLTPRLHKGTPARCAFKALKGLSPKAEPTAATAIRAPQNSCYHAIVQVEIKTIGSSGQISLGKQYAGRTVTVEQIAEGVWTIKTAQVIPDDELWLHTPEMRASLDRALEWSASHPRAETDFGTLARKVKRKL